MNIQARSHRTDLIFAKFSGQITDCGSYTLIRTPDNPHYYWGNYIIFDGPPQPGDHQKWTEIFKRKFSDYDVLNHMVFTWEPSADQSGGYQEWIDQGFELDESVILATERPNFPIKYHSKLEVKRIKTDEEWEGVTRLQLRCADPKFDPVSYEAFKRTQMREYRAMSEAGMGDWFGAYLGHELIGDLGVFFEGEIARYQSVGTHPDFRRQGVCQTLVYEAALIALETYQVSTLVMEADMHAHAAKIYQSLGFKPVERKLSLTWWTGAGS